MGHFALLPLLGWHHTLSRLREVGGPMGDTGAVRRPARLFSSGLPADTRLRLQLCCCCYGVQRLYSRRFCG